MEDIKLGLVEAHFADIVWKNAPITTKELVAVCAKLNEIRIYGT